MPRRTRVTRPQLSDSWGTFDNDISEEEESGDSAYDGQEIDSPRGAVEEDDSRRNPQIIISKRNSRKSTRIRQDQSAPKTAARRTKRGGSQSVEPQLVMPTMEESTDFPFGNVRVRRGKVSSEDGGTRKKTSRSSAQHDQRDVKAPTDSHDGSSLLSSAWTNIIAPVLRYTFNVIGHAMLHLQPVIGVALALAVVGFLLYLAASRTFSLGPLVWIPTVFRYAASPCSIPGLSSMPMICSTKSANAVTPQFDALIEAQNAFEEVLESASDGYILPLAMKNSESSIRDLRTIIHHSSLPSKNSLVFEMNGYIETAKIATDDLSRFNSHIGRTVDHIIAANRFTLHVIDDIAESDSQHGSITRALAQTFPFFKLGGLSEADLLDRYLRQTSEVEAQINHLIIEAQNVLRILQNLDDRLDVIHDLAVRDGVHITGSLDELFVQLWTKVGGNRRKSEKMKGQLDLLAYVNTHRRQAMKQLSGKIIKLLAIRSELENLRDKVAEPELLGVHVPLSQHIATIQMGVERLEAQRENARSTEQKISRTLMDGPRPADPEYSNYMRSRNEGGKGAKANEIEGDAQEKGQGRKYW